MTLDFLYCLCVKGAKNGQRMGKEWTKNERRFPLPTQIRKG